MAEERSHQQLPKLSSSSKRGSSDIAGPLRILVTGPPGIGKTTLCGNVYRRLREEFGETVLLHGFLGVERRERGRRVGFDMVTLDESQRAPLASVDGPDTGIKVGKYNVQLSEFEGLTLPILDEAMNDGAGTPRAFIFDEIGKMELYSNEFVQRVRRLLRSPNPHLHVLGTVAMHGGKFIAESKRLPGVEVLEIDASTRDAQCEEVFARFGVALHSASPEGTARGSLAPDAEGVAKTTAGASGASLPPFRLPAGVGVSFDAPLPGQFSAVYLPAPEANFASVNAGDYWLYVGGAAINKAFREALEGCGHSPQDRYETLHAALLAGATATPGQLHWLEKGALFPKPAAASGNGGESSPSAAGGSSSFYPKPRKRQQGSGNYPQETWCGYCKKKAECWTVSWSTCQGQPLCADCWEYWDSWAFQDLIAFCGLVPHGGARLQKRMEAIRPVGLVSIAVFPEGRRPCSSSRNVAMVYVVGPNAGGKQKKKTQNVHGEISKWEFLEVIEEIGASISYAVSSYNEQAPQRTLPDISILRICLVCGGVYKHPAASKVEVASMLIRGLLRTPGPHLPILDFAFDEDVFQIAWNRLVAEGPAEDLEETPGPMATERATETASEPSAVLVAVEEPVEEAAKTPIEHSSTEGVEQAAEQPTQHTEEATAA